MVNVFDASVPSVELELTNQSPSGVGKKGNIQKIKPVADVWRIILLLS